MNKTIFYKHPDEAELFIFENVWYAERYLEPIDIEDGIFYNSKGMVLSATTLKDSKGIEHVVINQTGTNIFKATELKEQLVNYLEIVNSSHPDIIEHTRPDLEKKSLSSLVELSLRLKTE